MDISPNISKVHGQSVGWHLCSSVQTPRRPRSLNLTHSISLPERGNLPREALENYSLYHTCNFSSTEIAGKKGSENSTSYESSSMLQGMSGFSENSPSTSPQRQTKASHRRVTPRWQNLFIPESEMNEDEEDEDSDGDNLHKYHEGSSLQLQSFNVAQSSSIECKAGTSSFSQNIFNYEMNPFSKSKDSREQERKSDTGYEERRNSKGTPITFMDCDEQDWVGDQDYSKHTLEEPDNSWVQTDNLLNCESLTQNPTDYITDSSCNSSDGILVNFSAIYNKTNNAVPATPLNQDSPDHQSGKELQDGSNPIPSWSSRSVDPNSNIYPLDPDGFSSIDISDLAVCLQSQARLTGSTQNYYKLVTCDLSSQSSPSPPWSSLTSFSETHSQESCSPPSEYFLFGQSEGEENERPKTDQSGHQGDGQTKEKNTGRDTTDQFIGSKEKIAHAKTHHKRCNYIKTPQSQSWINSQKCFTLSKQGVLQNSCPSHLNTNVSSPQSKQHATSFAEISRCKKGNAGSSSTKQSRETPSCSYSPNLSSIKKENASDQNTMSFNHQNNDTSCVILCTDSSNQSNPEGESASSSDVVRYTKAQRPTSLPIQPFVLQAPSEKQHNKTFGSLLNQYISHKYSKPGPSKATCKSKEHPHHTQLSPLGNYSSVHLEAATSSDTCSTCTSSPVLPHSRPQSTQPCTLLGRVHQNLDLMNRSRDQTEGSPKACSSQQHSWTAKQQTLLLISTNQDKNCPPKQVSPVQTQTPPVIKEELLVKDLQDESYPSQNGSPPAITSVTSLTSITSLISLPRNGRRCLWPFKAESQISTSEGLSTKICHYFTSTRPPSGVKKERQHGDSCSRTDRPPEKFCLSPEASSEPCLAQLLHKKSMLKALSLAVDLIITHFSSRRELEEIKLENSSLCSSISQHLCPAIQNILQDGLKAYKLDVIVGQRSNKLWNVVQATARPGSSTQMPDSLVSVIKKCSHLSHNMRLYVFIMDLLNLRALELWIRHLYSRVDIIEDHYHQRGFLAMAQGPMYEPLFQELLHLLQPLSLLPFNLYLPCETQIHNKHKQNQRTALPHKPLVQSDQILQMSFIKMKNTRGPTGHSESAVCCSDGTHKKEDKETGMENSKMPQSSPRTQDDKPTLRWARLFGSACGTPVGPTHAVGRSRRPSEWLKIGASKVDLVAQSVWSRNWTEIITVNHDRTTNSAHILNLY